MQERNGCVDAIPGVENNLARAFAYELSKKDVHKTAAVVGLNGKRAGLTKRL